MNYFESRYCFYILLAITLLIYFISDMLKHRIEDHICVLNEYIENNRIFDIGFVKVAYEEFEDNPTVKKYINNYNYLLSKKSKFDLSQIENEVFLTLSKDIELLKISFLTSIVLDNQSNFDILLVEHVKKFISIIKKSQLLRILKITLTIPCLILFIKIILQ